MPRNLPQAIGFLIGVWIALLLLLPLAARGEPGAVGLAGERGGLVELEHALHADVNAWRAERRLVALERRPALDAVARRHSADMAARGYLAHESPEGANPVDRLLAGGVEDFSLAGENVGMTTRGDPNAEILGGWVVSPEHHENLSAPAYNATGVGIARRADGALVYTQLYVTFPR